MEISLINTENRPNIASNNVPNWLWCGAALIGLKDLDDETENEHQKLECYERNTVRKKLDEIIWKT